MLPGVGHFAATERLDATGLTARDSRGDCARRPVPRHLRRHAVAVRGIDRSARAAGPRPFRRILHALCRKHAKKFPHVGWNSLEVRNGSRLLAGVEPGEYRLLHALLQGAGHRRHRGGHALHRAVRRGRRARQRDGRAVSSGEIRRDGPEDSAQFLSWSEGAKC